MSDPLPGIIRPAAPSAPEATTKPAFTAGFGTLHAWGLGSVANYWMYSILGQLVFPLTVTFGVDPRVLGWAQAVPRLVTAILGLFIGHASDITHTRWGRRRPWMVAATIFGAILSVAVWWMPPGWPTWAQFLFLVPMFILLYAVWDIYDMAHTAMGFELSDDYCQRSKVVAIRSFWFVIAAVGGGFFYSIALALTSGGSLLGSLGISSSLLSIPALFPGDEIGSLRFLAFFVGGIILVFGLIPVFAFKERFTEANRWHVNIWRAILATFKNRPFVVIVLLNVAGFLGSATSSIMNPIMLYDVASGSKYQATALYGSVFSLFPTLGMVGGIILSVVIGFGGMIAMIFLAAPLTRLVGKRLALMICYGVAAVAAIVLPFCIVRGHPELILLHGFIFSIPGSIMSPVASSVMPDICDLDEFHFGERREGLYLGVSGFISKILFSLCLLIGTYALAFSGCDTSPGVTTQTAEVLTRMRWLAFAPPIVFSLLAFVISCFYPLTEKAMAEVRTHLDERRAAIAGIISSQRSS